MPTLIRLIVALLFLGGLGFGAMYALSVLVVPGEKEIRVRIPARDLTGVDETGTPITTLRDQLPAPTVTEQPATTPPPATTADPNRPVPDMSTFE